jgi:multidrug resistance efflux pump
LLGVGLVLTSLAGANRLLHSDPASAGGGGDGPARPAAPPVAGESLVAKGTVTSDPPTFAYVLPAHLAAGEVAEVFVQNGQSVKAGDALVRFKDDALRHKHKEAEDGYNAATQDYNLAVLKHKDHAVNVEKARLAIADFTQKRDRAKEQLVNMKKQIAEQEKFSQDKDGRPLTPAEIDRRVAEDHRVTTLAGQIDSAENAIKLAGLDLKAVEAAEESLQGLVRKAAYAAKMLHDRMDEAAWAIAECTVKAKIPGTVEQLSASLGQTIHPHSRPPLFYLVPSGKRIVSVEVVPEFAHKLKNRVDQKVQITDDANTHLAYEGVVKRIGSAFLPKANGAPEIINGKSNAVLTVEIEVIDATPAGKPPLRVGQPVRVTFP